MKSLQGHLLVASPKLADPNFFHAVVLVVQHSDEGALGLVLNRPMQTTIREMWEQVGEGTCAVDGPLHQGGPCEGPLMVIHAARGESEIAVSEGIHFSTNRDRIEKLVGDHHEAMKFFVGYAGWTAGQLESELDQSSWLTLEANPQVVFEGDEHVWTDLIRAISRQGVTGLVDPKRIPDDPSVN